MLAAEGADCTLDGLFLAASEQHVDNHTVIDHGDAPLQRAGSSTRESSGREGAASSTGRSSCGRTPTNPTRPRSTRTSLLSDDALMDTAPQLEIHNNDVKCRHAAAIGRLDQDAIFYLRSRGMARDVARSLLVHAFAQRDHQGIPLLPDSRRARRSRLRPPLRPPEAPEGAHEPRGPQAGAARLATPRPALDVDRIRADFLPWPRR